MAQGYAMSEVHCSSADPNPKFVEATIETNVLGGASESTCNNNSTESSAVTDRGEREKSLEYAEELMARGSKAGKEGDYAEATDCYSRALEIRVAYFGELAPECANAYFKYGCALLYKAQEEADPFGSMPNKDGAPQEDSNTVGSVNYQKEVLADDDEEAQWGSSVNQEDPDLESSYEDGFESAFHGTELGERAEGDEE